MGEVAAALAPALPHSHKQICYGQQWTLLQKLGRHWGYLLALLLTPL